MPAYTNVPWNEAMTPGPPCLPQAEDSFHAPQPEPILLPLSDRPAHLVTRPRLPQLVLALWKPAPHVPDSSDSPKKRRCTAAETISACTVASQTTSPVNVQCVQTHRSVP